MKSQGKYERVRGLNYGHFSEGIQYTCDNFMDQTKNKRTFLGRITIRTIVLISVFYMRP